MISVIMRTNCSSLESHKSQRSLVVAPLSSALVYFCIIFYGTASLINRELKQTDAAARVGNS